MTSMWVTFWGVMIVLGALVFWNEWSKDHE